MFVCTWFESLKSGLTRPLTRRSRRSFDRRVAARRLLMEGLEDRRLLAFDVAANYPVAVGPQAVLVADFNNDGHLDVATANANYGSDTVSVLLGNADGTFGTALNSAVGDSPMSLAVGDFNTDGKLDLVMAHYASGTVRMLLGNGNGTFGTAAAIALDSKPTSVAVGDFNADGKLDIVATGSIDVFDGCNYYGCYGHVDGRANVLLGTGAGTFAAPIASFLGYGSHTGGAAVADFNGDGKRDLASTSDLGTVDVLLGTGGGSFGSASSFSVTGSPNSMTAGDVNGDGKIDLVTANANSGTVGVLLGTGTGTFGTATNYAAGSSPRSVALADFNGDGKIDLVTANADSGTVSALLGNGTGAFRPPVNVLAGVGPIGVAFGNFNGDGRPDVVSANVTSNNVSVLLNDGTWPAMDAPSITIGDITVTEGNTGTVSAAFSVTLSAAYGQQVTVAYSTLDGSAVAGSDYQAASGTLMFAPGVTSQTITVQVIGDRLPEYTEFFFVRLTDPTNAFVANATGTGTILDDEPTVSISGVTQNEGSTSTTAFTFTVTLSTVYDAPVTVDFATADLTPDEQYWYGPGAEAGVDYIANVGTLTFTAGETSQTITVLVIGDLLIESDEFFFVNLSNPSSEAILGSSQAWGTILNDDLPLPSVTINDVTVTEGNTGTTSAIFTVSLSNAYNRSITVHYQTAEGSASASVDYAASSGDVIFLAGETSKTIPVAVIGDRLAEQPENFFVNLSAPSNAAITRGQGVGTILDNEPRISINNVSMKEGNGNGKNTTAFVFTVTLSAAYDQAVTVNYATVAGGTATAGIDYQSKTGTVTFMAGETTKTITIFVYRDNTKESDETFFVDLFGNSSNSLFTKNRGVGTILNDD